MIDELIVCLTIESQGCGSRRFDRYTAGLHQAMVSTDCVTVQVAPWFVLIGAFRSSLRLLLIGGFRSSSFRLENCSLGRPPWYRSVAV